MFSHHFFRPHCKTRLTDDRVTERGKCLFPKKSTERPLAIVKAEEIKMNGSSYFTAICLAVVAGFILVSTGQWCYKDHWGLLSGRE
jgi:hypothetical protein